MNPRNSESSMERALEKIWIREASYRYRVYYAFIAVMIVIPKPTSIFLENSITEKGILQTYLPLLGGYIGTIVFGLLAFFFGHFSGFLMRKLLSGAVGSENRFHLKYILSFAAGPMTFLFLFKILDLIITPRGEYFSSLAAFVGFFARVASFSFGLLVIMAILGALSLRGLRRFVKNYKDYQSNVVTGYCDPA